MIKFIKTISTVAFFIAFLFFSFDTNISLATNCHNYGGSTTYCDDGTSYSNYGGSTTYGSDGTSYSNYGGSTTYGSDGSTQTNYGGSTTYSSDGTSYSNYGGSTTYGSDGSIYNDYGGSTTYGSGSGKMIKIPNHEDSIQSNYGDSTNYDSINEKSLESDINCPLNSRYDSSSSSCECNYGYVASGSRCIYKGSGNSDSEKDMPLPITDSENSDSSDLIPSSNTIPNNNQYNKNLSSINQKTENKKSAFVWWNPLTWWNYFFNKSTSVVDNKEIESMETIKPEVPMKSLEWKEYKSDDGKFTALFPGEVSYHDWMDNATLKKLGWNDISKIDSFNVKTSNNEYFSVWLYYYANKNYIIDKTTLKLSLHNLLNLMKNYKLISSGYSKHEEYDVLDYLIFNEKEDKYEKGKFIAAKQNVYQIIVDYKKENLNDTDIDKFFLSFYLQ